MRHKRIAALHALLALALLMPFDATSQQEARLSGSWALDRARSDDVDATIDDLVRGMNFIVRPVARRRLRAANPLYPRAVFSFPAQEVRIEMQGGPTASSPSDGRPVLWNRLTGADCPRVSEDCVRLSTHWQDGRLVQRFQSVEGERRNVYTVASDGRTMRMVVTLTSPRLPRPLSYELVFDRPS